MKEIKGRELQNVIGGLLRQSAELGLGQVLGGLLEAWHRICGARHGARFERELAAVVGRRLETWVHL